MNGEHSKSEVVSSKTVTWREIVTEMGERFTSLNSIPVERATIRRHEWKAILQKLHDGMPSDETSEKQTLALDILALMTRHVLPQEFKQEVIALCSAVEPTRKLPCGHSNRSLCGPECSGLPLNGSEPTKVTK